VDSPQDVTALRDAGVSCQLSCPKCHFPHVDEGNWATTPHRTHLCARCEHLWRPYPVATYGVLMAHEMTVIYENYRGEVGRRRIIPLGFREGATEHHPTPQPLLEVYDLDKQANRTYAVRDVLHWGDLDEALWAHLVKGTHFVE
jgi:hypothetical protein